MIEKIKCQSEAGLVLQISLLCLSRECPASLFQGPKRLSQTVGQWL